MKAFVRWTDRAPLWLFALLVATLGMVPWVPEPYIVDKLRGLLAGEWAEPLDGFVLIAQALPWLLMAFKLYRTSVNSDRAS